MKTTTKIRLLFVVLCGTFLSVCLWQMYFVKPISKDILIEVASSLPSKSLFRKLFSFVDFSEYYLEQSHIYLDLKDGITEQDAADALYVCLKRYKEPEDEKTDELGLRERDRIALSLKHFCQNGNQFEIKKEDNNAARNNKIEEFLNIIEEFRNRVDLVRKVEGHLPDGWKIKNTQYLPSVKSRPKQFGEVEHFYVALEDTQAFRLRGPLINMQADATIIFLPSFYTYPDSRTQEEYSGKFVVSNATHQIFLFEPWYEGTTWPSMKADIEKAFKENRVEQ